MDRRKREPAPHDELHVDAIRRLEPYMNMHSQWVQQQEAAAEAAEPGSGPVPVPAPEPGEESAQEPPDQQGEADAETTIEIPVVVPPAAVVAHAPPAEVVAVDADSVPFGSSPPAESPVSDAEEPDMTPAAEPTDGLRAELDKAPSEVAAMFDRVAARYDLVNDLLALGQTRIWRNMVVRAVNAGAGDRILDLAAGTGTSSAPFAALGAQVVPCDFSLGMLKVGKQRQPHLPFVAGDALNLPFKDESFDAVTISFGLRNVHDTDRALREMLRVTKPGGKIVVCEFSSPVWGPFRTLYSEYLMKLLPALARKTSSNPAAYVYLAESIRAWPDQPALAARLQQAGWERVQWRNATGGIVAIHRGFKPTN